MDSGMILVPGGLRLRSLHPLLDEDGSCGLLYDMERNALIEVPEEFAYHAAYALENGDLDEGLLGWLASEDLLTYERSDGAHGLAELSGAGVETCFDTYEPDGLGSVCFLGDRAHCRIGSIDDPAAVEMLESLRERLDRVARITFHLSSSGDVLALDTLRRIVEETIRRGKARGQEIDFELTLDAAAVTLEAADFLSGHPFELRVRCDDSAAGDGFEHLLARVPDLVTLHCVLSEGQPLSEVWAWARQLGARRLQATRPAGGDEPESFLFHDAELRRFRRDVTAICEEMLDDLQNGREPLVYEPVVRVMRRLMGRELDPRTAGEGAYWGLVSNGQVFPVFQPPVPSVEVDPGSEADKTEPCSGQSDFRRAEVEESLLFCHRLAQIDPGYCLGLLGPEPGAFTETFPATAGLHELKTC